jgi:hypothetical protein
MGRSSFCDNLDQLGTATDDHPSGLGGADRATFVSNRCMYSEDDMGDGRRDLRRDQQLR